MARTIRVFRLRRAPLSGVRPILHESRTTSGYDIACLKPAVPNLDGHRLLASEHSMHPSGEWRADNGRERLWPKPPSCSGPTASSTTSVRCGRSGPLRSHCCVWRGLRHRCTTPVAVEPKSRRAISAGGEFCPLPAQTRPSAPDVQSSRRAYSKVFVGVAGRGLRGHRRAGLHRTPGRGHGRPRRSLLARYQSPGAWRRRTDPAGRSLP